MEGIKAYQITPGFFDLESTEAFVDLIFESIPTDPHAEICFPYAEGMIWFAALWRTSVEESQFTLPGKLDPWISCNNTREKHACSCNECMKVFTEREGIDFITALHPLLLDTTFCNEVCLAKYQRRSEGIMPHPYRKAREYEPEAITEDNIEESLSKFETIFGGMYPIVGDIPANTGLTHGIESAKIKLPKSSGLKFRKG